MYLYHHQAKGTATLEQPPTSVHFSEGQKIRPPAASTSVVPAPVTNALPSTPMTLPNQATDSQALILQLALTNPALAQLILQQQQQQQQQQHLLFFQNAQHSMLLPQQPPTQPAALLAQPLTQPAAPLAQPVAPLIQPTTPQN